MLSSDGIDLQVLWRRGLRGFVSQSGDGGLEVADVYIPPLAIQILCN